MFAPPLFYADNRLGPQGMKALAPAIAKLVKVNLGCKLLEWLVIQLQQVKGSVTGGLWLGNTPVNPSQREWPWTRGSKHTGPCNCK